MRWDEMFLSSNNTEKFNSHVYSYKMLTFPLFCTFSFFSFITFSSLYTNFTRKISLITIAFLFFVKLTRKKYKSCKNLNWKISNYYISIPFIFKIEIKYFHRRFSTNDIVGKWNNFHHCFSTKQSLFVIRNISASFLSKILACRDHFSSSFHP